MAGPGAEGKREGSKAVAPDEGEGAGELGGAVLEAGLRMVGNDSRLETPAGSARERVSGG